MAAGFGLAAASAQAAHTQADLVLAADRLAPGTTVMAGIHLRMEPQWHTYWRNSGASGIATSVKWDLPRGIAAGAIQWPLPEKLPPDDLATYVYQNDVVLLVPLKLAPDMNPGPVELKANVSWLECKEQCIPGSADVNATLIVGPDAGMTKPNALIEAWQRKVPRPSTGKTAAGWEKPADGDMRPLIISAAANLVDFYPDASNSFEVQGATEHLTGVPGQIRLRKLVKKYEGGWPTEMSGVCVTETEGGRQGVEVKLTITDTVQAGPEGTEPKPGLDNPAGIPQQPLWRMLLYAFIGGLILNAMPCVLPVIALKILGFVGESAKGAEHVRRLGLVYALGVLFSFVLLAGLVIGVKAAGHKAGWGLQFSNPQFVVILIVLVTLVALNLFGLFEINLGGRALNAAGSLASKRGTAGAFFNGVLATVLATPCTAPFLGTALGFAFTQKAPVIVLMFLTVGLGLALPYVVLSWQPAWLRFLPKPGPWMEKFKIAMGCPMLATAVWLLSLTPSYYGKRAWWLGVFLVIVALAAWVYGEFVQRGRARRPLALAVALILLGGGYGWAVEKQLNWRQPVPAAAGEGSLKESAEGIPWERWDLRAVTHAQQEGHAVLVDFTADWCLTCQANKHIALEIPSVRAKLKEIGAATFLGDYTRFPEDITAELNRYGRAGVPLVLVYPPTTGAPPIVLPELLTPGIVLDALNRAAK